MNLARVSWHIGDYLRDTSHLRAAGHGAYFLLCLHYYANGSLPDDDRQLATIARMTDREWREHREVIKSFFHDGWKHKRADKEIKEANERYERRALAGSKGGAAKASGQHCSSNATAMLQQPITLSLDERDDRGRARVDSENLKKPLLSQEAHALAAEYRSAARVDPDDHRWASLAYTAQIWIERRYDRALLLSTGADIAARKGDKPMSYHTTAVQNAHEDVERRRTQPQPKTREINHAKTPGNKPSDWQSRRDATHAALTEFLAGDGEDEARSADVVPLVPHARKHG
jgi:uncharacterized protein YdaU (DUF1376 family)